MVLSDVNVREKVLMLSSWRHVQRMSHVAIDQVKRNMDTLLKRKRDIVDTEIANKCPHLTRAEVSDMTECLQTFRQHLETKYTINALA